MSDSLDAVIGVVWSKNWNEFNLSVIRNKKGRYRSLIRSPRDEGANMCRTHRDNLDDAIKRCWSMVCLVCKLKVARAQNEMHKPNSRLHAGAVADSVQANVGK